MAGIQIGVRDLMYAKVISDTKDGAVYGEIKPLADVINITITPTVSTNQVYASDKVAASAVSFGGAEVELEITQLDPDKVADILGIQKDAKGVLNYSGDINPDYVGIFFRSPLHNGSFRYVQLVKGMFSLGDSAYATKGESVEFQNTTISGNFITRDFDNMWRFEMDDNETDADATVIADWFTTPYNGSVQAPTQTP